MGKDTRMAGIIGAHHTSFTVAHLEKSVEFFRDLLGLELLFVREVENPYLGEIVGLPGCKVKAALLKIPGANHHVELFQYLTPAGESYRPRPCDPGSSHLSLLVDDLPGLYQQLHPRGVRFVSKPILIDAGPNRGGYGVYLRDPNDILIELFQLPQRTLS
jgi:catechol 2,3-dioxygenase-like lactoylglutathione lyase family enzyme